MLSISDIISSTFSTSSGEAIFLVDICNLSPFNNSSSYAIKLRQVYTF